jgi:hypothetical protein
VPDSPSTLPPRPSLEQLKKQAKERLEGMPGGTLAEAQFALARHYGFESWAKLKHHVEALPPVGLEQHEGLARDLVAVFRSDDVAAAQRLNDLFHSSLDTGQIRQFIKDRLITAFADGERRIASFGLPDAQLVVARLYGFDDWQGFVASSRGAEPEPGGDGVPLSATPPFYSIDRAGGTIEPRQPMSDRDWDVLIAIIKDRQLTGINARQQMSDAVLARIANLDQITRLDLDGCNRVTDAGLAHLDRLSQLEELNLSGWHSRITDSGLAVLRSLKKLRRFDMAWPQRVTDAGMANLQDCSELESVTLMGTRTGDGAIRALADTPRLRRLFAGNTVTDAGLALLKHVPRFKSWSGEAPEYSLLGFDAGPTYLGIDGTFSATGLRGLAGLDGLFALNLSWSGSDMHSDGLAALSALANLGFVAINGDRCDDAAFRQLGGLPRLRMLLAQEPVASDEGFVALGRSRSLEYLWGRECPNMTGRGFAALTAMPSLRGLAVSCKFVDDSALATLAQSPTLTALMPMDVTDEGFRHVGRCAALQDLWCMYCADTGDAATEHIRNLTLRSYYAGGTQITDRSLEVLGGMDSLERLQFHDCRRITNAGMRHLAALPSLREVTLEYNRNITRTGAAVFPPRVRVKYEAR